MAADEAFVRVNPGDRTVEVIAGQHHKFMLIPIMENETTWFVEGPLKIGVESRAFGRPADGVQHGRLLTAAGIALTAWARSHPAGAAG